MLETIKSIPEQKATVANVALDDAISFADLGLAKPILESLVKSGYTHPTPIQAGAIPPSIAGRDLLLSAQTGSGKTAAFVLPILHKIADNNLDASSVRAVILTPTRELAMQVQDSVRNYSGKLKGLFSVPLVGGAPYSGQIRALKKGVQIIVATPGRFLDHLNDGRINLQALEVLVLDEADRMLDMGFSEDINRILSATPANRQTIMSSATWDGQVGKIAESFTKNPERINIKVESAHIDESVYFCDDFRHKNALLEEILNNPEISQAIIFASTKMSTEKLADDLLDKGYKARYLHGDLPQGKRNRIVADVKAGKCQFLVATDVAARGIDIATISHVINYDLPRQAEDYVHRIGRSGRAGRTGQAINLCSVDDRSQFFAINRYLKRHMKIVTIDGLEPKRDFSEREFLDGKRKGRGRPKSGGRSAGRSDSRFGRVRDGESRTAGATRTRDERPGGAGRGRPEARRSFAKDANRSERPRDGERSSRPRREWDNERPKHATSQAKTPEKRANAQGFADRKRQKGTQESVFNTGFKKEHKLPRRFGND